MNVVDAIRQRRSVRRFADKTVPMQILKQLAGVVAECYPCPGNLQPLRFLIVDQPRDCERVFSCLKWAGLLNEFVIEENQRPKAYIIILGDRQISEDVQFCSGAAAAELMLLAQEQGLASCCLTPAKKQQLQEILTLDGERMDIVCAVALGYPGQKSFAVPAGTSLRYFQDQDGNLCVPKRPASETVEFFDTGKPEKGEER